MTFQQSVGTLLDLLLPGACLGCGSRIPPEEDRDWVCVSCKTRLRRPPPPRCSRCDVPQGTGHLPGQPCLECASWPSVLVQSRAAAIMEPPADALVHALKYEGWMELAGFMARRMASVLNSDDEVEFVTHVPTTPRRRRRRGYDQARVLAKAVAGILGLPCLDALERRGGGTQVRLTPEARRQNVEGKFRVLSASRSRIQGAGVILIDDVLTTGATATAVASVLGEAGARSVRLLTFARALPFVAE